jgi:hypothetical protein
VTGSKHLRVPPGFALVRIDDLAALTPRSAPENARRDQADTATWEALAASIAILTARLGHIDVRQADLIGDTPPAAVIKALVILTAATLAALMPDQGATLLRDLVKTAAQEGTQ